MEAALGESGCKYGSKSLLDNVELLLSEVLSSRAAFALSY